MKTYVAVKKIKNFWTMVFIIFGIISLIWASPTCQNEIRSPIEPYKTLEEEYIAAIETFINTKEVVVPEDSAFYYDNQYIRISNNENTARVSCHFALNNTVPVYSWYYESFSIDELVGIIVLISLVFSILHIIFSAITIKIYLISKKSSDKKKQKKLEKYKVSAEFGDERFSRSSPLKPTCINCEDFEDCKCLDCIYVRKCGKCPSYDCIEAFEEFLSDKINEENSNATPEIIEQVIDETQETICPNKSEEE